MPSKRLFWPDFVRAVAIGGVVMIHVVSPLVNRYALVPRAYWGVALALGTLARASVPLFFMLSGALFLGRDIAPGPFLKKRAARLLLPFFFWSLLYDYRHLRPFSLDALWQSLLHIVQENTSGHLWFFYTLFGLYLILPVLSVFVRHARERLVYYYLGLWVSAVALLPLLDRWTDIYPGVDLRMVSGYAGYLVLGYLLQKGALRAANLRLWAGIAAVSLTVTFLLVWRASSLAGSSQTWALGYLTLQVIAWAAASFVFLRAAAQRIPGRWQALIRALSRASFGIYLVHIFFIRILERLQISVLHWDGTPLAVLGIWLAVMLLSWGFTWAMQQVPLLRRLTP